MNNEVVVTAGQVFAITSRNGDIVAGGTQGLYAHDTRFLSEYRLRVHHRDLDSISSSQPSHATAIFYATNHGAVGVPPGSLSIIRDRYIRDGFHEDIAVINHSLEPRQVRLELMFDADFADVFEVRVGPVKKQGSLVLEQREGVDLCLVYRLRKFRRETWISCSIRPQIKGKTALFDLSLRPKEAWRTCVTILPITDPAGPAPSMRCVEEVLDSPLEPRHYGQPVSVGKTARKRRPLDGDIPRLITDKPEFQTAYKQAILDLRALRMEYMQGRYILAAGLPWYMAVFGRDSIISAIQTKLLGPELMVGTLYTLAGLQAKRRDAFREAEPGKIPHEVRMGELATLERIPHSKYYGSVDATPLFLVLLWEAYQWTGDLGLVEAMLPAAQAALRWIDRYGDTDGDGFVEHKAAQRRRPSHKLRNQGWKDSGDAISFADGRLADGSLALAEVQGYVYDAKCKMADLFRSLGDVRRGQRLERDAQQLKTRFNEAFWMPEEGYFAVALDGQKRRVDSITSNPGHCLWSGIVDDDKAGKVMERLMAPDMFSGWGIRTLSADMARYHPVSYHNGSIWPHDNSLIAAGMTRYGAKELSNRVATAVTEAACMFSANRLPELYAGYPRRRGDPVPYPDANAPQAWASGAVVYFIEAMLDVHPAGDRLLQEVPHEELGLSLSGVPYRGSRRLL